MGPILKVDNLSKVFLRGGQQPVTAVKNVSFELMPGECLGVLGESGSGKTTMVSMITRLLDVTVGQIILDGQNITNLRGKELRSVYRKMQMVFQTPADSFDPRKTLGEGIGESLRNVEAGDPGRSGTAIRAVRTVKEIRRPLSAPGQRWAVSEGGHCPGAGYSAKTSDL